MRSGSSGGGPAARVRSSGTGRASSYFEENEKTLKPVAIDSGDGCVAPSAETAQSGEYKPLSRPFFVYVKKESLQRPEVRDFVEFTLDNADQIGEAARFIPATEDQIAEARSALASA